MPTIGTFLKPPDNAQEWGIVAQSSGTPWAVGEYRTALGLRNPSALTPTDPLLAQAANAMLPTADNPMLNQATSRYEAQLTGSGTNEAAAASKASRFKNQSLRQLAEGANSFYSNLLALQEEAQMRKMNSGASRDPMTAQFQNFMGSF